MSLDMNESVALELGQKQRDVLDEIAMEDRLSLCRLPASRDPARDPLGQTVDAVL
jgi:hypothetical protein